MAIHPVRRPTPQMTGASLAAKCPPPPESVIYPCDTPSLVEAVPEFGDMGGVLISYPGTVARSAGESQSGPVDNQNLHVQLPPGGPRAFGIPDELIIRMQQLDSNKPGQQPVHIFILCSDPREKDQIARNLAETAKAKQLSFDADLLHLVPWDTDTYWTRDYGPWWVRNKSTGYFGIAKHVYTSLGGGSVGLVEGSENVPPMEGLGIFRPNDDFASVKFSDFLNAPIRQWNGAVWTNAKQEGDKWAPGKLHHKHIDPHDWYFTGLLDVGGNYMVTGDGAVASSYLVAAQNQLPEPKESDNTRKHTCAPIIEARMQYIAEQLNRFMGISKYYVLTDPSGTYIGHIDCWGKFLGKDKILIAQSEDPQIDQAYNQISNFFEGNGFQVCRVMCQRLYVPMADPATAATTAAYTNSLILNNYVYVPIVGAGHGEKHAAFDQAALQTYQEALPDHTIVGIPGKPEYPWLGTDAMHCRTREVPRQVVENWLASQSMM